MFIKVYLIHKFYTTNKLETKNYNIINPLFIYYFLKRLRKFLIEILVKKN